MSGIFVLKAFLGRIALRGGRDNKAPCETSRRMPRQCQAKFSSRQAQSRWSTMRPSLNSASWFCISPSILSFIFSLQCPAVTTELVGLQPSLRHARKIERFKNRTVFTGPSFIATFGNAPFPLRVRHLLWRSCAMRERTCQPQASPGAIQRERGFMAIADA